MRPRSYLAPAGVVVCVAAVTVAAAGAPAEAAFGRGLLELLVVGVPIAAGLYALRVPVNRNFGIALLGVGFGWSLTALGESSLSLPYTVGRLSTWFMFPCIVYLLLAFPTGRIARGLDRALGANAGMSPMCAANPGDVNDQTTVSYRATPANISIDMILDEGARELLGEYTGRWYDLKRTGTLIDRTKKYNPWTKFSNTITDKFYLRPIPQGEIDNSNPKVEQNPGY